ARLDDGLSADAAGRLRAGLQEERQLGSRADSTCGLSSSRLEGGGAPCLPRRRWEDGRRDDGLTASTRRYCALPRGVADGDLRAGRGDALARRLALRVL